MTPSFTPQFWQGTHPLSNRNEELHALLVPDFGAAPSLHGELLRCVTRIYYDLYNNGLANGPFEEEAQKLRAAADVLKARMTAPTTFEPLLHAIAPPGAKWGSLHLKNSEEWRHAPALEDLTAATVQYAHECVQAFEKELGFPANGPFLVPAEHACAALDRQLAHRHLAGKHAETVLGELYRATLALVRAATTTRKIPKELTYEVSLLQRFAPELETEDYYVPGVAIALNNFMQTDRMVVDMAPEVFEDLGVIVVNFVAKGEGLVRQA